MQENMTDHIKQKTGNESFFELFRYYFENSHLVIYPYTIDINYLFQFSQKCHCRIFKNHQKPNFNKFTMSAFVDVKVGKRR